MAYLVDRNEGSLCIDTRDLAITTSTLDYVILVYLMFPTIAFGILGNLINLVVLLSKEMRSG